MADMTSGARPKTQDDKMDGEEEEQVSQLRRPGEHEDAPQDQDRKPQDGLALNLGGQESADGQLKYTELGAAATPTGLSRYSDDMQVSVADLMQVMQSQTLLVRQQNESLEQQLRAREEDRATFLTMLQESLFDMHEAQMNRQQQIMSELGDRLAVLGVKSPANYMPGSAVGHDEACQPTLAPLQPFVGNQTSATAPGVKTEPLGAANSTGTTTEQAQGVSNTNHCPQNAHVTPACHSPCDPCRKKTTPEFDGKVSLEAYMAQFEMLASASGWNSGQKAVELATSLRGNAVELLGQMAAHERSDYETLVAALERRYGTQHQTDLYRTKFRTRMRKKGESLQDMAQDLEHLAHRAYPTASTEMKATLLKDQFVDGLHDPHLKLHIKQASTKTLQEALARALEYEAIVNPDTGAAGAPVTPPSSVRAHQGHLEERPGERVAKKKSTPTRAVEKKPQQDGRVWRCFGCLEFGHRVRECPRKKSPTATGKDKEPVKEPSSQEN